MYTGVPTNVSKTSIELKCLESPKSVILTRLLELFFMRRMFSNLRTDKD